MISYFGGKATIGTWIYQFIPKDIKKYVEPFSGAFWVYMNPDNVFPNLNTVVYNDINGHMANLYSCLSQPETFLEKYKEFTEPGGMLYTQTGDKEFYKELYYKFKHDTSAGNFLDNPPKEFPDFDAGLTYSFLITSSFNSCFPRAAGFSFGKDKPKILSLINKLKKPEYLAKLKGITNIHNIDFAKLITMYDGPDTYFYLDPPYEDPKNNRLNWYGVKDDQMFGRASHERLAGILKNIKGKFSLSYYWFEELEKWFPRDEFFWVDKEFFRSSAAFSETKDTKGTEILIMNYDPTKNPVIEIDNKKIKRTTVAKKKELTYTIADIKTALSKHLDNDILSEILKEFEVKEEPKKTMADYKLSATLTKESVDKVIEEAKNATFFSIDEVKQDTIKHEEPKSVVFNREIIVDETGERKFENVEKKVETKKVVKEDDDFWG